MVRALRDAGVRSPIVFAILSDPIGDGIVASLAHPGGNVTGLSMAGTDLESKRMEILKEAVPGLTKVLLLHDPTMGPTALDESKRAAFFFQAEDGIRDGTVTGVQTCALPI